MFSIYDTQNKFIASFNTKKEALNFLASQSRWDWTLKFVDKKPTERMLAAVRFIESILPISFIGDIKSAYSVSAFLANWLERAKAEKRIQESIEYMLNNMSEQDIINECGFPDNFI